jgi:hypothetical protein
MKLITSNLLKFAIFFALGSILFRFGLNWSITNHAVFEMWIFAILYFIFNAGIGWFFGKKDYESFPLNDIGFRFHFVTYVVFNIIWELWFLFGFQSRVENVKIAHQIAFFWGISLLLHFIIYLFNRKNTIKGLDKSEIFE